MYIQDLIEQIEANDPNLAVINLVRKDNITNSRAEVRRLIQALRSNQYIANRMWTILIPVEHFELFDFNDFPRLDTLSVHAKNKFPLDVLISLQELNKARPDMKVNFLCNRAKSTYFPMYELNGHSITLGIYSLERHFKKLESLLKFSSVSQNYKKAALYLCALKVKMPLELMRLIMLNTKGSPYDLFVRNLGYIRDLQSEHEPDVDAQLDKFLQSPRGKAIAERFRKATIYTFDAIIDDFARLNVDEKKQSEFAPRQMGLLFSNHSLSSDAWLEARKDQLQIVPYVKPRMR